MVEHNGMENNTTNRKKRNFMFYIDLFCYVCVCGVLGGFLLPLKLSKDLRIWRDEDVYIVKQLKVSLYLSKGRFQNVFPMYFCFEL